jgi:penicillin-binding protein 1A
LNIYLASVRFEKGVYGVTEAMKHFWGEVRLTPTMAESFFLVERVSNIKSKLLTDRIIQISKDALKNKILTNNDIGNLLELYRNAVSDGKIIDADEGVSQLGFALCPTAKVA